MLKILHFDEANTRNKKLIEDFISQFGCTSRLYDAVTLREAFSILSRSEIDLFMIRINSYSPLNYQSFFSELYSVNQDIKVFLITDQITYLFLKEKINFKFITYLGSHYNRAKILKAFKRNFIV